MLRTFAESLAALTRIYWKRFAAWAVALRNRYRQDAFFRTEWNVIGLQSLFAVSILSSVAIVLQLLYLDVGEMLAEALRANSAGAALNSTADILQSIQEARTENLLIILFVSISVTVVFGYFIAHVTLAPARETLASQKRFISDVAHELRTPLSVIKTNSEVALLDAELEQDMKKTLKSNIEELDRMSDIINNLLTFSAWKNPRSVAFSTVDLGLVIDGVVAKMKPLSRSKRHQISLSKRNPLIVWGNNTALEQIVTNILKNAINYTPEGGRISINAKPDYQGNIILAIEDTGIGITRKDLFHIFEPFFRAERSRNRQSGSSGLGLAIVSELIKLHRGRITVKSVPNEGTTVTVLLPYTKERLISPEKQQGADEISVDFLRKNS